MNNLKSRILLSSVGSLLIACSAFAELPGGARDVGKRGHLCLSPFGWNLSAESKSGVSVYSRAISKGTREAGAECRKELGRDYRGVVYLGGEFFVSTEILENKTRMYSGGGTGNFCCLVKESHVLGDGLTR